MNNLRHALCIEVLREGGTAEKLYVFRIPRQGDTVHLVESEQGPRGYFRVTDVVHFAQPSRPDVANDTPEVCLLVAPK